MKSEEYPFLHEKCTNQFSRIIIEIDLGAPHKKRHPKKTVIIYLGGEGFEGQMFKKSVDLKRSKLTFLSEKKTSRNSI